MTSPSFQHSVAAGTVIFRENDPGDDMYIVQSGKILLTKQNQDQDVALAVLEEGDFFGESGLVDEYPRGATATADTDAVLLRIDRALFQTIAVDHPEIPIRMLRIMSRRLRRFEHLLAVQSTDPDALETDRSTTVDESAVLIDNESQQKYPLAVGEVTSVGRYDPLTRMSPDIDLTDLDHDRSTSRRHASIIRRDDRFFLREELGVANGTQVDGNPLATGEEVEITSGSELRFGLVSLVFQLYR